MAQRLWLPVQLQIADRDLTLLRPQVQIADLQLMSETAMNVGGLYLPGSHQVQPSERSPRATAGACDPGNQCKQRYQ